MSRPFYNVSGPQGDGVACVMCGADFLKDKITSVVVGCHPVDDASVYACKEPCARLLAEDAERMAREMRVLAGLDDADVPSDERDDPVFCVDGHFGSLLRDLRTLAGTEALLSTSDDNKTLRFLLSLTARHAETAMMRARLVLARTSADNAGGGTGGDD
ncbi:hypothetical protein SAMN04487981_10255 [Streptomyces sp. cf386]|uniref:hypothetical protein n=1 Tax=Streptomyces sp. cf386 TaxID=1761904 RepID=UPI000889726D|nr:hypothetical protein [Streptomyces sp. cf386]SDM63109.1 hypothetical protein SAMN04487981_10255 [Streptomyces sp. cf386]